MTLSEIAIVKDKIHELVSWILGAEHLLYHYAQKELLDTKAYNEAYFYYIRGLTGLATCLYQIILVDAKIDKAKEEQASCLESFDEAAYVAAHPRLFPRLFDLFDVSLYKEGGAVYEKKHAFTSKYIYDSDLNGDRILTQEELDFLDYFFDIFATSNNRFYNMYYKTPDLNDKEANEKSIVTVYEERPLIVHTSTTIYKLFQIPKRFSASTDFIFSPIMIDSLGYINANYQDGADHTSNNIFRIFFSKSGFATDCPISLGTAIPEAFLARDCLNLSLLPDRKTLAIGALILLLALNGCVYTLPKIITKGKDIMSYMHAHNYRIPRDTYGDVYLRALGSGLSTEQAREEAAKHGCSIAIE